QVAVHITLLPVRGLARQQTCLANEIELLKPLPLGVDLWLPTVNRNLRRRQAQLALETRERLTKGEVVELLPEPDRIPAWLLANEAPNVTRVVGAPWVDARGRLLVFTVERARDLLFPVFARLRQRDAVHTQHIERRHPVVDSGNALPIPLLLCLVHTSRRIVSTSSGPDTIPSPAPTT